MMDSLKANLSFWETLNSLQSQYKKQKGKEDGIDELEFEINDCHDIFSQFPSTDYDILFQKYK